VAVPEGEVVFAGEPLLRVTASLVEAQMVETLLMNQIASHTMLASKAARVSLACDGRDFVDYSARRDHGPSAAMAAARTAWIAGSAGTSLVAAGQRWGIPLSGTMAHSYVMAFADEREAFRSYARVFPRTAVLLVDTYDTVTGVRNALAVAQELSQEGVSIAGVRLDSGDVVDQARRARALLDDAGLTSVRILASGDLDEYRITELVATAPIDAFGVGTQLGTSADAPALGAIYKLVADSEGPRMKLAEGKVTMPGRKQVWRGSEGDVVGLEDEPFDAARRGRPLLQPVMKGGARLDGDATDLESARARCARALEALPPEVRSLQPTEAASWPVHISPALEALTSELARKVSHARGVAS
jgi:nicotinate phosphoribosyltransferase